MTALRPMTFLSRCPAKRIKDRQRATCESAFKVLEGNTKNASQSASKEVTRVQRSLRGAWIRHAVPSLASSQLISFLRSPHEPSVGGVVTCEKDFKVLEVYFERRPAFSSLYSRNPPRRPSRVGGSHLAAPTLTVLVLFRRMFSYCK